MGPYARWTPSQLPIVSMRLDSTALQISFKKQELLTVNSFGKAFAHVRNCLLMKKAHGTNRIVELNKNIDGFYTKTTQKKFQLQLV
jgi:hypothetical protein